MVEFRLGLAEIVAELEMLVNKGVMVLSTVLFPGDVVFGVEDTVALEMKTVEL